MLLSNPFGLPLINSGRCLAAVVLLSLSLPVFAIPTRQPREIAGSGVSIQKLQAIDAEVEREIAQKRLPGAVVMVGRNGGVVWRKTYGARTVEPVREAMTTDTIFDVASLTKVVATATSIMILVERGRVRLSDPLSSYIPEMKGEGRERITIELLLTHRSGYAPDFDLRERWTSYDEAVKRLIREPLRSRSEEHTSELQSLTNLVCRLLLEKKKKKKK